MENQEIKSKKIIGKIDQAISGLKGYAFSNKNPLRELLLEIKTDFENLILKFESENSKDIRTVKMDAETKLEESENILLTTLYSIGDAVISTDNNGNIVLMNPVAEKLTGWTEKEVKGKSLFAIFNIINQDTRKKVENPVERVLSEGIIVGLSNHTLLISKNGTEIPISDSGAPIKDSEGNIHGVILVFRDNTMEVEANRLIHESEIRLRRAEIASFSGNWELNSTTGKIIGSTGAQKLYELHKDIFSYEEIKKIPLPEYRPLLDTALKNLIEHNDPYDLEFKIKTAKTGKIKCIHSTAFYDKEKGTLFGVIQDISKQKEVELLLKKSEKKYKDLFEKSDDPILIIENNKFVDCNNSTVKLLRYKSKDELLNTHPSDISPEFQADGSSSFEKAEKMMLVAMQKGSNRFEWHHKKADGEIFPVEVLLTAITIDDNNKILYTVWRDITKRKQAEDELYERMSELERFNKFMTGRELRMMDLKKEVNELLEKLGQQKKYKAD